MEYVALALAAAVAVEALVFGGVIRSLVRQQARERDLILNQMCALAGRPWQAPPSAAPFHVAEERDLSFVIPDQWPEDEL